MKSNKSGLLLLELVISLVMFTFCAAVCIRLFYAASRQTKRSDELTHALRISESIAEILKSDSPAEALRVVYPKSEIRDSFFRLEYDDSWKEVPLGSPAAAYAVAAEISTGKPSEIIVCPVTGGSLITDSPIFSLSYAGS